MYNVHCQEIKYTPQKLAMKKTIILSIVALCCLISSCNRNSHTLEENSEFDLEKIDFKENIPQLYSKNLLLNDGSRYDETTDGELTDDMIAYRVSNSTIEYLNLKVPKQEFGYLFKSYGNDTIAKFADALFSSLWTLTDLNKSPIAYYAETEFDSLSDREAFMKQIITKYGKPKYAFFIKHEFDQCSFEWQLADRTIQIKTSHGFRTTFSFDGNTSNGMYYNLRMLIISNKHKDVIRKAHLYQFPDIIDLNGKQYSYKELGLEKINPFYDDFSLMSDIDEYRNEMNNLYHISRSESYIEEYDPISEVSEKDSEETVEEIADMAAEGAEITQ